MKKLIAYTLWIAIVLAFAACDSQDGQSGSPMGDPMNDMDQSSFLADVEGISLNADVIAVTIISFGAEEVIQIVAQNTTTRQILTLQFPKSIAVGSHTYDMIVAGDAVVGVYIPDSNQTVSFISQSGILNITHYPSSGEEIEGNTVFTLANPTGDGVIEVTFCEFSIQL